MNTKKEVDNGLERDESIKKSLSTNKKEFHSIDVYNNNRNIKVKTSSVDNNKIYPILNKLSYYKIGNFYKYNFDNLQHKKSLNVLNRNLKPKNSIEFTPSLKVTTLKNSKNRINHYPRNINVNNIYICNSNVIFTDNNNSTDDLNKINNNSKGRSNTSNNINTYSIFYGDKIMKKQKTDDDMPKYILQTINSNYSKKNTINNDIKKNINLKLTNEKNNLDTISIIPRKKDRKSVV